MDWMRKESLSDFLVGAPYDSQDGRGAIHVFNGNAERRFDKPSQVSDVMCDVGEGSDPGAPGTQGSCVLGIPISRMGPGT